MANVYQQAAKQRKWIYLGSILGLFVSTLVVRGTFFGIDKKAKADVEATPSIALTMDGRAKVHELTELQQGETELGGAAVQLLLTGSRGLAICGLWMSATEKQKKQEWNELDIAIDSITKLQPHFTSPWLFQSWNLTYNVSVEMDRLNDMYFYIARGISVVAKGESLNRDNPNLRYYVAFYLQNKFGVSDRVTTLRCLYQLSCIPDEDRDPEKFKNTDGSLNLVEFEKFTKENPQFVRRLKEVRVPNEAGEDKARPLTSSPEGVVAFLKSNRKLPSRYKPGTRDLNDRLAQFPVLPEHTDGMDSELNHRERFADHQSDAFLVARAWYMLANSCLPPTSTIPSDNGSYNPDPLKYKIPKQPSTIIFRQGPPRAQSYVAERLTKEGWFDAEPWAIDGRQDASRAWIPKAGGAIPTFTTPSNAQVEWAEAYRRWRNHGEANGLLMDPIRLKSYQDGAELFVRRRPGFVVGQPTQPLSPDEEQDPEIVAQWDANRIMGAWATNRQMTNFEVFLIEADALRENDAVLARKRFHQADRAAREELDVNASVRLYEEGFAAWKRVLGAKQDCRNAKLADASVANRGCRDFRDIDRYQEDMYELNLKYVKELHKLHDDKLQKSMPWLFDFMTASGARHPAQAIGLLNVLAVETELPRGKKDEIATAEARVPGVKELPALRLAGPLDGNADDGTAWITADVKLKVREKLGLIKRPQEMPAPGNAPGNPGSPPIE